MYSRMKSPLPSSRGLPSSRRNLIDTRPISPRARVQQLRKLPSLDTRSFLANPNNEFAQPAYILEQKLKLCPEVESLRNEVDQLREHYKIILGSFNEIIYSGNDEDNEDNQNEEDAYYESLTYDLSTQLAAYQEEISQIEASLSTYNAALTEDKEFELKNYVTKQKEMQSSYNQEIEIAEQLIAERTEMLNERTSSPYYEKIEKNNELIADLTELLALLRQKEKKRMKKHEAMCNLEPPKIESNPDVIFYTRKLQMIEHQHAQKSYEYRRLKRDQELQRNHVRTLISRKMEDDKKRQQRNAFHESYKKKVEAIEEANSRKLAEIQRQQELQNTEQSADTQSTRKRRKHKHRHWHHHKTENDDDIVFEKSENQPPIMFKTEVENIDTLLISGQE